MKSSRNIKTVELIEALRKCSTPGVHCDGCVFWSDEDHEEPWCGDVLLQEAVRRLEEYTNRCARYAEEIAVLKAAAKESKRMRKSCKTCGNSSSRPAVSEACLTCAFGDDGTPTNWKELTSTNGDRVRDMCDGEMAKFFAKKVMEQVAWIQLREGVQMIGGTQLAAMKEAYALTFFSWLRSPAEEGL